MSDDMQEVIHTTALHAARAELTPILSGIFDLIHETCVIEPGTCWTIPLSGSCGFEGQIVIRVAALGECQRSGTPFATEEVIERTQHFIDTYARFFGLTKEGD